MTIKRLIGTAPSQVPRNRDLGSMAYQDVKAVNIEYLQIQNNIAAAPALLKVQGETPGINMYMSSYGANATGTQFGISKTSTSFWYSNNSPSVFGTADAYPIYIVTNGAERIRVNTSGNVSIGGIEPTYAFDLYKNNASLAQFYYADGTYNPRLMITGSASGISIIQTYTSSAGNLILGTAGTERFRLDGSGNANLGPASTIASTGTGMPTFQLLGSSAGYPTRSGSLAFITQDGTSGKTYFYHDSGDFWIQTYTNNAQKFYTNNVERLRIAGTGEITTTNTFTPQSYNEQTLTYPSVAPSLHLDFAGSESISDQVTFTRDTIGSYYGKDGFLKYAQPNEPRIDYDPTTGDCKGLLIEEARTNMCTGSWGESGIHVERNSTASLAPDGTFSAVLITETEVSAQHLFVPQAPGTTANASYTFSVYVKTISGSTTWLLHRNGGPQQTISLTDPSMAKYVGNGWYRIWATLGSGNTDASWYVSWANNLSYYVGSASPRVMIWGWQVEAASFPSTYIPPKISFTSRSSSASYFDNSGVLRYARPNQPRYGYGYDSITATWKPIGLMYEYGVTNLLGSSSAMEHWNLSNNVIVNKFAYTAPDGGKASSFTNTANLNSYLPNTVSLSANTTYTFSIFVKPITTSAVLCLELGNALITNYPRYDVYNQTVIEGTGWKSYPLPGGWYRLAYTWTVGASTGSFNVIYIGAAGATSTTNTLVLWGPQLELGGAMTSYVPTPYGSTSTRQSDSYTVTAKTRSRDFAYIKNHNSFGPDGFSWLYEFYRDPRNARSSWYEHPINLGWSSFFIDPYSGPIYWIYNGSQGVLGQLNLDVVNKFSGSISYSGPYKVSWNGGTGSTVLNQSYNKSTSLSAFYGITLGSQNGNNQAFITIKKLVVYPNTLNNTQLQALSST